MNEYEYDFSITGNEPDILNFVSNFIYNDNEEQHVSSLEFNHTHTFSLNFNDQSFSIYHIEYRTGYFNIVLKTNIILNHWLFDVFEDYSTLIFEIRYTDAAFSGIIVADKGTTVEHKIGFRGKYYGDNICEYCKDAVNYMEYFCGDMNCCADCEDNIENSKLFISNYIRRKNIDKLNKSLALKRMGRNYILDQYIMRRVFMKRLF